VKVAQVLLTHLVGGHDRVVPRVQAAGAELQVCVVALQLDAQVTPDLAPADSVAVPIPVPIVHGLEPHLDLRLLLAGADRGQQHEHQGNGKGNAQRGAGSDHGRASSRL
jgi:hypothetical protein